MEEERDQEDDAAKCLRTAFTSLSIDSVYAICDHLVGTPGALRAFSHTCSHHRELFHDPAFVTLLIKNAAIASQKMWHVYDRENTGLAWGLRTAALEALTKRMGSCDVVTPDVELRFTQLLKWYVSEHTRLHLGQCNSSPDEWEAAFNCKSKPFFHLGPSACPTFAEYVAEAAPMHFLNIYLRLAASLEATFALRPEAITASFVYDTENPLRPFLPAIVDQSGALLPDEVDAKRMMQSLLLSGRMESAQFAVDSLRSPDFPGNFMAVEIFPMCFARGSVEVIQLYLDTLPHHPNTQQGALIASRYGNYDALEWALNNGAAEYNPNGITRHEFFKLAFYDAIKGDTPEANCLRLVVRRTDMTELLGYDPEPRGPSRQAQAFAALMEHRRYDFTRDLISQGWFRWEGIVELAGGSYSWSSIKRDMRSEWEFDGMLDCLDALWDVDPQATQRFLSANEHVFRNWAAVSLVFKAACCRAFTRPISRMLRRYLDPVRVQWRWVMFNMCVVARRCDALRTLLVDYGFVVHLRAWLAGQSPDDSPYPHELTREDIQELRGESEFWTREFETLTDLFILLCDLDLITLEMLACAGLDRRPYFLFPVILIIPEVGIQLGRAVARSGNAKVAERVHHSGLLSRAQWDAVLGDASVIPAMTALLSQPILEIEAYLPVN